MLSRMAFVPAFGKERQCTQMTSPSGHRSPPARYPVALCTAFDLQPATHPGRATMSHILSSDRRPVSLSMPSLNVNSLLNLLVNRSCQGFPFQMGASYRRLQGVDDASLLAVVRAFSEYGSRVFGLSRHALILNHVCIRVTSRALRRMRSARVRSARPRASGPTLHALSRARSHRRSRARRLRWRSPLAAQAGDTARFSLTRVHRPEDVQSVVAPWKAPFGSMRSCLGQSRGSHRGAVMPRHSHFRFTIRTSLAPQLVRRPTAVADLLRVSWVHRIARRDRIGGWRSDDYKATTAVMLEAPESARRTDSYVQQTTHKRQSTCENRLYRTFMALIGISS